MPRPPRVDVEGAIHHIAALAVQKEHVFREPADRRRLMDQLETIIGLYGWKCSAYCLMGSHFHLIVETPRANLSRGMQHLCGSYAQWFNWKYGRRGHLFGRRFGSVLIVREEHFLEAHRYVALNPVRANLCRRPESWQWGSFRALAGLEQAPKFLDADAVLGPFSIRPAAARLAFWKFVASAVLDDQSIPLARVPTS